MLLGRVVGSAVATVKLAGLEGVKLLVVQPLDRARRPKGSLQVAVDTVDAGPGDTVVLVRSREASLALPRKGLAVDLAVVGVVDSVADAPASETTLAAGYTRYT